ncbi:MAG: dihydropteroate synthase, partial [Bacteroidota bacterium]
LDPELMPTVAQLGVPFVLMHMQGTPQTMQENPTYTDAVAEVIRFLADRAAHARSLGIADIMVDPGFGFGKKLEHNMALMRHLDQLQVLGLPVLVGVSRKSIFRHLLGISPDQSLNATTVMHTLALERGARILRTHDVRAASEAIRIVGYPENR